MLALVLRPFNMITWEKHNLARAIGIQKESRGNHAFCGLTMYGIFQIEAQIYAKEKGPGNTFDY